MKTLMINIVSFHIFVKGAVQKNLRVFMRVRETGKSPGTKSNSPLIFRRGIIIMIINVNENYYCLKTVKSYVLVLTHQRE